MSIVAYLSAPLLAVARTAVPVVRDVASWSELVQLVRIGRVGSVLVDPGKDGWLETDALMALRATYPTLRIVLYTHLGPEAVRPLMRLALAGFADVVLYRYDDQPERLQRLLTGGAGDLAAEALVAGIEPMLAGLPASVARAIADLYQAPMRYRTADDLALKAGISRRTLYRKLASAGFQSPRRLVESSRAIRAYVLLMESGRALHEVATRLGYHRPEHLARHVRDVCGDTPRELRAAPVPLDVIVGRVVLRLRAPDAEEPDIAPVTAEVVASVALARAG